jgi:hypothetical protein
VTWDAVDALIVLQFSGTPATRWIDAQREVDPELRLTH